MITPWFDRAQKRSSNIGALFDHDWAMIVTWLGHDWAMIGPSHGTIMVQSWPNHGTIMIPFLCLFMCCLLFSFWLCFFGGVLMCVVLLFCLLWLLARSWLGHDWAMIGACLGHDWAMIGPWLDHAMVQPWSNHGPIIPHSWPTHGTIVKIFVSVSSVFGVVFLFLCVVVSFLFIVVVWIMAE